MHLIELLHDLNPAWRDARARISNRFHVRREIHGVLLQHLSSSQRRAAVLVGPRQVGKTTLLLQLADDLLDKVGVAPANVTYFDFSDDRLPIEGVSPRDVVDVAPPGLQSDQPRFFLFDEVSRGGRWAEWLKHAVDARHGRFLVTDSAATLLRQAGRESGLGRWDEYRIEGLSMPEYLALQPGQGSPQQKLAALPDPFGRYLSLGGFPEHAVADSFSEARRRIREDTTDRAIRRDLLRFDVDVERIRELFVYLVSDSGAIFDAAARARLLQRPESSPVDRRSLEKWIARLEDTRLIVRLDPFARAATGKLAGRSYPKLYAFDHGLVVAFSGVADPLGDPSVLAPSLEATVFRHLRGCVDRTNLGLAYLRDKQGLKEADFVVHEGRRVRALVEVTVAKDPDKKLEQMAKLARDLKAPRSIVVHGGLQERREGAVWFAPAPAFLMNASDWIGVA
jgi:predicted AAA+ superfamily ATPase